MAGDTVSVTPRLGAHRSAIDRRGESDFETLDRLWHPAPRFVGAAIPKGLLENKAGREFK